MTITKEEETEINRLVNQEGFLPGEIYSLLGYHPDVTKRVLALSEAPRPQKEEERVSLVTEFIPFIKDTLKQFPHISAKRIFGMVRKRGYTGRSEGHFRRIIATLRPVHKEEAYIRRMTLKGEESQVDWADFSTIEVEGGTRKLMGFVMTLSWSRAIFLHFFWGARMLEFQTGFRLAFEFFDGVARVMLLDNLKSGVTTRIGTLIQFNNDFLEVCKHYGFQPKPVRVRRGNEKGRVERSIRYIRENFFEAREWKDLDDLNAQAREWCLTEAMERPWKMGVAKTVGEAFLEEKVALMKLPPTPFPCYTRELAKVGKTSYARFDTNDYSVPAEFTKKEVSILADTSTVRILNERQEVVATHTRNWGKHQTMTQPNHINDVLKTKKHAEQHGGMKRLVDSVPIAETFLEQMSMRQQNLGGAVSSLLKQLDQWGKLVLHEALTQVLKADSISLRSVHLSIRQIMDASNAPQEHIPVSVPEKVSNISVKHHDLSRYDIIARSETNE
jgi:transposase